MKRLLRFSITLGLGSFVGAVATVGAVFLKHHFGLDDRASLLREKKTVQVQSNITQLIQASHNLERYVKALNKQAAYLDKMVQSLEPNTYQNWVKYHLPADKYVKSKLPSSFFSSRRYNWLGFKQASNQAVASLTWLESEFTKIRPKANSCIVLIDESQEAYTIPIKQITTCIQGVIKFLQVTPN